MKPAEWIALISNENDKKYARAACLEAGDEALAAIAREREGEVSLGQVVCIGAAGYMSQFKQLDMDAYRVDEIKGKTGTLIFRPKGAK